MTLYSNMTAQELSKLADLDYDREYSTWLHNNLGICSLKRQILDQKTIQFWNDLGITYRGSKQQIEGKQ